MSFVRGLGPGGKPGSGADPGTSRVCSLAMQSAAHGKQTERIAGARTFINNAGVERHGDGVSFVICGVVVLAVDQNEDRQESGFAIFGKLEHSQGAGTGVFLSGYFSFAGRDLGAFFLRRACGDQKTCTGQGRDQSAATV